MITRGVELRIVFPADFCRVAHVREYSAAMEAEGVIRFADALPHRLIVSSGSLPGHRADRLPGLEPGRRARDEPRFRSLRHLSVSLFRRGRTLAEVDPAGPTEIELRLLQALNSGATDEAAARALAISERTLRRYLSALLTKLGATSRFPSGRQGGGAGLALVSCVVKSAKNSVRPRSIARRTTRPIAELWAETAPQASVWRAELSTEFQTRDTSDAWSQDTRRLRRGPRAAR